jgi:hypothetical protein
MAVGLNTKTEDTKARLFHSASRLDWLFWIFIFCWGVWGADQCGGSGAD